MIIANFMDSSLLDLRRKGVFDIVGETYNPRSAYERVIHFTPHACDLEASEALRGHRIEIRVHGVSALQPLKFIRALAQTWRAFGHDKVDLVRGRLPYMGSLIGGLAARLRGLPFVVSLGGDNRIPQESDGYLYHSRAISYAMENAVLRLATRVIVPNRYTYAYVDRIIGANAARKRCAVIGWMSRPVPPADAGDDETLAAIGIAPDRTLVPIIGFVNRYKFSHVLFDVLEQGVIHGADGKPALFCFAGDGPLRAEGEQKFAGRDDVIFVGWQQKSIIQALLRRAVAVVIPMSGFVLLEAASIGKPVITSSVEWHGELVADGRSGLLVDPQDRAAWRVAIARMLAEPAEARAMGGELKAAYWQHFSPDACVAAEHRLYEDLTGKRVAS
jgi:glycosyltransferase involved in cell wall biosynthesis